MALVPRTTFLLKRFKKRARSFGVKFKLTITKAIYVLKYIHIYYGLEFQSER